MTWGETKPPQDPDFNQCHPNYYVKNMSGHKIFYKCLKLEFWHNSSKSW